MKSKNSENFSKILFSKVCSDNKISICTSVTKTGAPSQTRVRPVFELNLIFPNFKSEEFGY